MLSQSQRPMPRPMLIPGIHTAMVLGIDTDMEDMDTGEERRGKQSQPPQPTLRPMLSLGTLPMDMADIEGMDTMERVIYQQCQDLPLTTLP